MHECTNLSGKRVDYSRGSRVGRLFFLFFLTRSEPVRAFSFPIIPMYHITQMTLTFCVNQIHLFSVDYSRRASHWA